MQGKIISLEWFSILMKIHVNNVSLLFSLFQRDFGAPLMCRNSNGIWNLYGILSHEGECSQSSSHPDVFMSIPKLKSWIDKVVGAV